MSAGAAATPHCGRLGFAPEAVNYHQKGCIYHDVE